MASTANYSFPAGAGPLKVDGVALGDSRSQVESILDPRSDGHNPTWVRYDTPEGGEDTVVCYQPAWPALELGDWQVHTICGSTLEQGGEVLLRVGEHVSMVRASLGYASPERNAEPGFRTMRFGCCLVVLDRDWRVAEISLSSLGLLSPSISGSEAAKLLDGSLAC